MARKPLVAVVVLGMAIGFAAGSGCQGYDVKPVVPKAVQIANTPFPRFGQQIAPNVMLVVDRSGSMTDPGDVDGGSCADSNGCYLGVGGGDCKWNELLSVFATGSNGEMPFVDRLQALSTSSNPVQIGLTYFSGDMAACTTATIADACSTGVVAVPVQANSGDAIKQVLMGLTPGGGTPTAATMAILPAAFPPPDPSLNAQPPNYVILLTDGAPNCDAQFTPTAANCSADRCTEDTSTNECPTWDNSCPCWFSGAAVPQTCLDEQALVTQITSLASQNGIKTFAIGFGVENNGGSVTASIDTLNAAAVAGGFALDGGFYAASNAADLNAALLEIIKHIDSPCEFALNGAPASQELIEAFISVNGGPPTQIPQQDFSLSGNTVTIGTPAGGSEFCTEITNSTPNNPVNVTFNYLTPSE